MKCLIFTNGDYGNYSFCDHIEQYDFIICADNGMKHARHLGVSPDLIVGDFDSTPLGDLQYFKDKNVPIEALSPIKDETDTEIALDRAIERGAKQVDLYGGLGTRMDHSLANVHLLYKALRKGVRASLMNPYNTVTLIDKSATIYGRKGDIVSLLPFSAEVSGIHTTNLGYPLKEGTLLAGKPLGVSNYMLKQTASISIKQGLLLVIQSRD
ncbi:MAG: thiamine pyrophosphokinae [Clostridia bacterium]|jgi:thiamine pyrophosphokinase|nr:thiamine pyrophosphokinae [Clostridia bacterium]